MTLQYSSIKSRKKNKQSYTDSHDYKQIEITIRKNGVIRIELIPKHLLNKKKK
jgi:hypothetical protein